MKIFQFYKALDQWEPSLDPPDQWECSTLPFTPIIISADYWVGGKCQTNDVKLCGVRDVSLPWILAIFPQTAGVNFLKWKIKRKSQEWLDIMITSYILHKISIIFVLVSSKILLTGNCKLSLRFFNQEKLDFIIDIPQNIHLKMYHCTLCHCMIGLHSLNHLNNCPIFSHWHFCISGRMWPFLAWQLWKSLKKKIIYHHGSICISF